MRGFGRSIVSVMSRYTDYAGRSSRAKFLWWHVFLLIPAGFIVLFVMCCLKGQPGPNAYGDEPTTG